MKRMTLLQKGTNTDEHDVNNEYDNNGIGKFEKYAV